MRTRLVALPIALLSGALIAGCGGAPANDTSEFTGAEAEVAEVIEDLQTATDEDAPQRVCEDLLARSLTQELGNGCERAIEQAFDDTDTSELAVEDVTVSGTTARARVTVGSADEDVQEMVELTREGNVWRISRFAGPVQN